MVVVRFIFRRTSAEEHRRQDEHELYMNGLRSDSARGTRRALVADGSASPSLITLFGLPPV